MLKRQIPEYRKKVYQLLDVKGEKFAYAVLKNKQKIDSAYQIWADVANKYSPTEEFMAYDKDRHDLAETMAKKDEKGEPVVMQDEKGIERFDIEDKDAFEKSLELLREKYAEAIKGREQQIADYEKEMDEEYEVDFHGVSEVPDTISARELEAAEFMIIRDDSGSVSPL